MGAAERHGWKRASFVAVVLVAATLAACDDRPVRSPAPLVVERDTTGDTIIVRTVSGSAWGDGARLEEELRIGARDGGDAYAFGHVTLISVDADGTIHVHDGAMKALRSYDSTGRHLRSVGRTGNGPGEYRSVLGLAALDDGRLLVRDAARVLVFSPRGEPEGSWPVPPGLMLPGRGVLVADATGGALVRVQLGAALDGGTLVTRHGYLRFDATGRAVDTLPLPEWPDIPPPLAPFTPRGLTAPHPHGGIVSARSDRYAMDLPREGGGVLRVERTDQVAVALHPGERAERQAMLDDVARRSPGAPRIVVPDTKPFLRELHVDPDGRLWVKPHVEAVATETAARGPMSAPVSADRWREPEVWDVFETDGAYLGRLTPPRGAMLHTMRGDRVWGVALGEDDVPSVVRWRIVAR